MEKIMQKVEGMGKEMIAVTERLAKIFNDISDSLNKAADLAEKGDADAANAKIKEALSMKSILTDLKGDVERKRKLVMDEAKGQAPWAGKVIDAVDKRFTSMAEKQSQEIQSKLQGINSENAVKVLEDVSKRVDYVNNALKSEIKGKGLDDTKKLIESYTKKEQKIAKYINKKILTIDEFLAMYHNYQAAPEQLSKHVLKQNILYKGHRFKITHYDGQYIKVEGFEKAVQIDKEAMEKNLEVFLKILAKKHFMKKGIKPKALVDYLKKGESEEEIRKKIIGMRVDFGFKPMIREFQKGMVKLSNCPKMISPSEKNLRAFSEIRDVEDIIKKIKQFTPYKAESIMQIVRFTDEQMKSLEHWGFTKDESEQIRKFRKAMRGKI